MLSRRELLAAWPAIAAAAEQARSRTGFTFFTPAEARDVEAMAEQIIPRDETPGAREAGVIYFIDRAVSNFFPEQKPVYRKGLATISGLSTLSASQQIEKIRSIEKTEFFEAVRTHTIMGFLADPAYGGNRDRAGWQTIGFSAAHVYRPPFGAYDT